MKNKERKIALMILVSLLKDNIPLSHLLAEVKELSPRTQEICFGVCRYYFQLAALANLFMKKKPKSLEVWAVLLMGLYQLKFMRQPDYAVVKETVELLEKPELAWARGLVNAILRTVIRQEKEADHLLTSPEQYDFNHPAWYLKDIKKSWPNDWQAIAAANDTHPPMVLRVNRLVLSREDYNVLLKEKGITASPHPFALEALILAQPCEITQLPGFSEGMVSIQDAAAQLAAHLLDLRPGIKILDACCAPGGKTCHILETEPKLECIAVDVDGKRLKRVLDNLSRLNLNASIVEGNALHPEIWWKDSLFDRILLDAPCSSTGVIRRHPDIKLLKQPKDISALVETQQKLLESLWPLLASKGKLLYATCSVLPIENDQQIAKFAAKHPDCQVDISEQAWGRNTGHGWQILPGDYEMDGFFYSILTKI